MSPKSDPAHFIALNPIDFLASRSSRVDFSLPQTDIQILLEAHAPGVFRLKAGKSAALHNEKPAARARALAEMLLVRHEPVSELLVSSPAHAPELGWRIEQGDVALEIRRDTLGLQLYRGEQLLLDSVDLPLISCNDVADPTEWRWQCSLDPDDYLHGACESASDLDRRGRVVVSGQPDSRALPLVWSTRGWGIYVNTFAQVQHDLAASDPGVHAVHVHDAVLDLFIFVGDPAEILNQYTALSGRAGQPGLWPMGVWLDQPQGQSLSQTLEIAQRFREQQWGLDAVRLAAPAPFGFQADKPVLEWDGTRVADLRETLTQFGSLNLQVCAPTFPGVLQGTGLFQEWEDRGWLLLNDESEAHVFKGTDITGGKPFALLDLTHKDVYRMWVERLRQLCDDGLGAPECNAFFDIPNDITARSGESGALLRTVYAALVRRALFDAFAGHKTPQEGVVLSADLFPSVQRFAWQTGPRTGNDWAAFEYSLRTALSLGDAGIPLQMHAIGSAQHPVQGLTPELYVRWLAASVFSGNFSFQAHPALLPDAFNAETQELVRHWLQWRYRLVPYVLGIVEDAVRTGQPVQRSMALAFPADPVAQVWDTQYMFGPALLVAPIVQPGESTQVYLPAGDAWWDLNTGWRYEGGTVLNVDAGLDTLPVFGREGHMLCLGPQANSTSEFNSARILEEVWMFGMPEHSPVVMRNKIRVMQMQGSSYIKGLEGLKILPSEGLEVKRRGAEVRISRAR